MGEMHSCPQQGNSWYGGEFAIYRSDEGWVLSYEHEDYHDGFGRLAFDAVPVSQCPWCGCELEGGER